MPAPATSPPVTALAHIFYTAHSRELLSYFRAALPLAKPDATDLLHQTFAELLTALCRHPETELRHPRTLLFTIAHRQPRTTLDCRRRQPTAEAEPEQPSLPSPAHSDVLEYQVTLRSE